MLTLRPTPLWRLGGPAFLLTTAGLMLFLLDRNFVPSSWSFQEWGVVAIGVLYLVLAVELPTKVVSVERNIIKSRDWFIWRERHLPPLVRVGLDSKGRVIVADAATGQQLVSITREFGEPASIENRLRATFSATGILAPAA